MFDLKTKLEEDSAADDNLIPSREGTKSPPSTTPIKKRFNLL